MDSLGDAEQLVRVPSEIDVQGRHRELSRNGRDKIQEVVIPHHASCQSIVVVIKATGLCPSKVHHLFNEAHLTHNLARGLSSTNG